MSFAQENQGENDEGRAFFFGARIRGLLSERGRFRVCAPYTSRTSEKARVRKDRRKNERDFPNGSDFGIASDFCERLPKDGRFWICRANLVPTSKTRRVLELPPIFRGQFQNEVGSEFAPQKPERLPEPEVVSSLLVVYAGHFLNRLGSEFARRIRGALPKAGAL
jgi:hypothetical protein